MTRRLQRWKVTKKRDRELALQLGRLWPRPERCPGRSGMAGREREGGAVIRPRRWPLGKPSGRLAHLHNESPPPPFTGCHGNYTCKIQTLLQLATKNAKAVGCEFLILYRMYFVHRNRSDHWTHWVVVLPVFTRTCDTPLFTSGENKVGTNFYSPPNMLKCLLSRATSSPSHSQPIHTLPGSQKER